MATENLISILIQEGCRARITLSDAKLAGASHHILLLVRLVVENQSQGKPNRGSEKMDVCAFPNSLSVRSSEEYIGHAAMLIALGWKRAPTYLCVLAKSDSVPWSFLICL